MYRLSRQGTAQEREDAMHGLNPLVDARVARHGGWRTRPKATYEFPGMTDAASWRRTEVAKATSWYGCAHCGQKFSSPSAVYCHMAKRHDR